MLALQENMKILMHTQGLHAKHVELVNIMIRQVRRPAKHVWLERIKIKLGRVIAKVVVKTVLGIGITIILKMMDTAHPAAQESTAMMVRKLSGEM